MICADPHCEASGLSASPFSSVSARAHLPLDCLGTRGTQRTRAVARGGYTSESEATPQYNGLQAKEV